MRRLITRGKAKKITSIFDNSRFDDSCCCASCDKGSSDLDSLLHFIWKCEGFSACRSDAGGRNRKRGSTLRGNVNLKDAHDML